MKYQLPSLIILLLVSSYFQLAGQVGTEPVNAETRRVLALIEESAALQNPTEALRKIKQAFEYEKDLFDSVRTVLYLKTGILYSKLYANDSALMLFNKALVLAKQNSDWTLLQANIYNYLGNVSRSLSSPQAAMEHYNNGLEVLRSQKSREGYLMESKLLGNIGGIYYDLADFNKALEYAERGRDVSLSNGLTEHYQMDYLIVGFAARAAGQYDKALENNKKALSMMLLNKDSSYLAHTYYNVASLHQLKENFKEAIVNFDKAIQFAQLFNEHEVLISCFIAKAQIFSKTKRQDEALALALTAESKAIENTFLTKVVEALTLQQEIVRSQGNYQKALDIQDRLTVYRDSLYKVQTRENLDELETKYESAKKEQTIKELAQANTIRALETKSARQWQFGLIVFVILLGIVTVVLYNRYQLKEKTEVLLNEKNSQLQKLNGFKDQMFAVISHDLRNPVEAFNTIIESLNQNVQYASQEELKEFLESTLQSAKDLRSLLNNLLEWSLVQIGKLPFSPASVSLKQIVSESLSQIDSMAAAKQIRIESRVDSHSVLADKSMINIIVRNLLTNAIKFSRPGKKIFIQSFVQNGSVMLSIRDEGEGMLPEELLKLFKQDQNVRSIGSSPNKGAGIGLLLCKELTDRNNGKIYAESEAGKGSTFYLELPST
ncbi:MAG: tetratricopeptide repeat-containing sensor histidine kinase [Cyclobacteriaceae bacterium]|nr:tetratricopeptide repeat-containing sensor histidine kinase [Cyclobacteriaceae bacterium]